MKFDSEGKCINAFEILSSVKVLIIAYNSIKSKPGNMTEGIDANTLDGIDMRWFVETNKALVRESWQPQPTRRVYIPKPNGKMRPLGISSPRDKIVQQAMRLTLETILEPKFSNLSHGFRPDRGCHTALKEVRNWKGVPWFIEGDIKNFFPTIDHRILEKLLMEHFQEARLINLYWKFAKAGYIDWEDNKVKFVATDVGVPQGGIVSPILSNLMLHSLDRLMEDLINKYDIKNRELTPHVTNPGYHKLTMRIKRKKIKINNIKLLGENIKDDRAKYRKLVKDRWKISSLLPNKDFIKIRYVRYADDFLIGVWGPKRVAEELKIQIAEHLRNLNLELSLEKTLITNARANRAMFLGTFIKRVASDKSIWLARNSDLKKRAATGNIWMAAPILELIKKLEEKGFLKSIQFRWSPKSIGKFTAIPIQDIILRYNAIVTGILNYYSFVDNRRYLNKVVWILKESLRKTISRKLKINGKIFSRKFGEDIVYKKYDKRSETTRFVIFCQPDLTRRPMLFLGKAIFDDPFRAYNFKVSTINHLGQVCSSCGSSSNIEMHHLRHIKTISSNLDSFGQMMAKINRKQVPLCRDCHVKVHKGTYQGLSLKNYNKVFREID